MRNFVACFSEPRDKYKDAAGNPANHDRAMAEQLTLADGRDAWVVAVADGCGGDDRGTRVAQLSIDRLRSAVEQADRETLSHHESASQWAEALGVSLQSEVMNSALKGGNSTLCAGIIVEDAKQFGSYRILMINVGDTRARLFSGNTLELRGIVPHAPESNPNTSENGKSLCRAVGLVARGNFPFFDLEVTLLDSTVIPFVLVICSDGVDSYSSVATVNGKPAIKENTLLYPREFKKIIANGINRFEEIPKQLLDRSLLNASASGFSRLDNSTIAMAGFQISPGCIQLPKDIDAPLPPPKRSVVEAVSASSAAKSKTATAKNPKSLGKPSANTSAKPKRNKIFTVLVIAFPALAILAVLHLIFAGKSGTNESAERIGTPVVSQQTLPTSGKRGNALSVRGEKTSPSTNAVSRTEVKIKKPTDSLFNKESDEVEEQRAEVVTNILAKSVAETKTVSQALEKSDPLVVGKKADATDEKAANVVVVEWPKTIKTDWQRYLYRSADVIDQIYRNEEVGFTKDELDLCKSLLKTFRDKESKQIAEHYNSCKEDLCSHCEKLRDYMKGKGKKEMDSTDAFYAMIDQTIRLIGEKEPSDVIESVRKCLSAGE